jgi:hypothetical protein
VEKIEQSYIGLDIVERLAQAYLGIEEVTDPSDGEDVIDGDEKTGQSEVEEVSDPSEDVEVIEGGEVSFRKAITLTVLFVWVVWNIVGLIEYVKTGNSVLLLTSPAVMSVPLHKVLGYHFHG